MTLPKTEKDVAIVGYSHRMRGGIHSDSDFWHLLSEREVVQEPISDRYGKGHLPIGEFSGPGRLASPYEGLIRDDDEFLFDRTFANVKRPLKGVFHLAGTLDDCLLADMSAESVARVFAPKARGALNLHRATAGLALDHFILVSSTSSTFGNPGQINYSAANAYLDGLAACRRQQGLPALSYNLAAVADAGMAARNLGVLRLMRAAGMPPVSSYFAIANLDYALRKMGDGDHLITALFKRVLWSVDSADYMRTGRPMSNQDAFEVGSDEQLIGVGSI